MPNIDLNQLIAFLFIVVTLGGVILVNLVSKQVQKILNSVETSQQVYFDIKISIEKISNELILIRNDMDASKRNLEELRQEMKELERRMRVVEKGT